MNFETFLRTELKRDIVDFSIRARTEIDGRISFYIHPAREGGNTADYVVKGNELIFGPFWRTVNNRPIELEAQIKHYQDFWQKQGIDIAAQAAEMTIHFPQV